MSTPLPIALCGARGRMGRTILTCAQREPDLFRIAAQIDQGDDLPACVRDSGAESIIDFTLPDATPTVLAAAKSQNTSLVLGTTGHNLEERTAIEQAARWVPIVFAANFSVGVNTLFWLTRRAAEILGPGVDLEIIEMHHRLKKDAPSGTARRLAEILAEVRKLSYEKDTRHGREGLVGERSPAEIGIHAVRGGDIVGEHTVLFAGSGERLELTHRAGSRETFAAGALRAARWLVGKPAGLYDMEDVLGLR